MNVRLKEGLIHELRENNHCGRLHLQPGDDQALSLDSRPSDGTALALRGEIPILVQARLFRRPASEANPSEPEGSSQEGTPVKMTFPGGRSTRRNSQILASATALNGLTLQPVRVLRSQGLPASSKFASRVN
jgi:bifunctional DNase/RNase